MSFILTISRLCSSGKHTFPQRGRAHDVIKQGKEENPRSTDQAEVPLQR